MSETIGSQGQLDTPNQRVERWKNQLLDLTLGNRLLNFRPVVSTIRLLCPSPERLHNCIGNGRGVQIKELLDWNSDDTSEPERALLERALSRNEVYAHPERSNARTSLESRLIQLYRKAHNDLQEGGSNTLFIAIGFLKWKAADQSDRELRAPLVMVPVELVRKTARQFELKAGDDEPRINLTLLAKLRRDFDLETSSLEDSLPQDEFEVNIASIWDETRRLVQDLDGFEVVPDVLLDTFSFAKFLMWRDLNDREDDLKNNPVVAHLIDTPKAPYQSKSNGAIPRPEDLDRDTAPADLFTPLPYDSSQLAAIVASEKEQDFAMIGPPGTGKSQTISNMIAHNIAKGRTVLFVSEKAAALDVVYRRLREVGLGDFCLELHSSKAKKQEVLQQLGQAWKASEAMPGEEWQRESGRLKRLRDDLNYYVERLHQPHRNGLTIHRALGEVVSAERRLVTLSWPSAEQHDREELERMQEVAQRLGRAAADVGNPDGHPLAIVNRDEWSPRWAQAMMETARALRNAVQEVSGPAGQLGEALGISVETLPYRRLEALRDLVRQMATARDQRLGFACQPDGAEVIAAAQKAARLVQEHQAIESRLSTEYHRDSLLRLDLAEIQRIWDEGQNGLWPFKLLPRRRAGKFLGQATQDRRSPDVASDLLNLTEMAELRRSLSSITSKAETVPGWQGLDTDVVAMGQRLSAVTKLRAAAKKLAAKDVYAFAGLRDKLHGILEEAESSLAPDAPLGQAAAESPRVFCRLNQALDAFDAQAGSEIRQAVGPDQPFLPALRGYAEAVAQGQGELPQWCAWLRARTEAVTLDLTPLVRAMESSDLAPLDAEKVFWASYCQWWVTGMGDRDDVLRRLIPSEQESKIEAFRKVDDQLRQLSSHYIRANLCAKIPRPNSTGQQHEHYREYGELRRLLPQRRPRIALRQLISKIPHALTQLTPCLLMSPLSVAQYLPTDYPQFDVVIFDEASQIPTWDAIGAIARGKQVIVAGDAKQLPPTNFFQLVAANDDYDDDDLKDLDSIFDEMDAASIPSVDLNWHYRSKNEGLIAFSNRRYYEDKLITFPSPTTEDRSVRLIPVDGQYARSTERTNLQEAQAVVEEVVRRLTDPEFCDANLTIGVVTFNVKQQTLVEDLLDDARREYPEIEPHFSEDRLEPVFVKNLETVQGDERDVILFSITYGPDFSGRVTMYFGPLNKQGGERRLNVAITRARTELLVFSSLPADQIDLSRTKEQGVADLKHYLEFAERGPRALGEVTFGPVGGFESPFEEAVAKRLRERGWNVHPQVGVASYRIDLGVVHPDAPGRYLAGVECDGATYHSAATARDRDKVREEGLRRRGWTLLRVWSTDFWVNPRGVIDRIDAKLREELERDRR